MLAGPWSCCEGEQQSKIVKDSIRRINQQSHALHVPGMKSLLTGLAAMLLLAAVTFDGVPMAQAQSPNYSAELTPNAPRLNSGETNARIQILTRPIGALVFLDGEYSMAGRTPYTISYFLKGPYRIRATKPGYKNLKKDYFFNGQGVDKLSIKMTPKTRSKALLRSAVFPGWGQAYSDHNTRGFIVSLMQFSAAGVLIYQHAQYNDALDNYNAALKNFRANQNDQNVQAALAAQVRARRADLDDAYVKRKQWIILTGVIYAFNLVDAYWFFPYHHKGAVDVNVSFEPSPDLHGAAVGLNVQAKF
jgi:hypothetical protein